MALQLRRLIRLKGLVGRDALAKAMNTDISAVGAQVDALIAAGEVKETPRGVMLTPEGRAVLAKDLAAERVTLNAEALNAVYVQFCELNTRFKPLMADWQIRNVDGEDVPNDHQDADYDRCIVDRLKAVDASMREILNKVIENVPRFAIYPRRFAAALAAVESGERSMMAAPIKDSYHTLWFELHEELIDICGRTRLAEALSGHGD